MPGINGLDFQGKRVLTRVDFNVPFQENGQIADDSRMRAHLKTLKAILAQNGRPVVMAHLGRPKGEKNPKFTLAPVAKHLAELLETKVHFAQDCVGEEVVAQSKALAPGEVLLLENVRFYAEETAGEAAFAENLAAAGDVYVNDAFGAAHRSHASTAVIARYFEGARYLGLVMEAEIENVNKLLHGGFTPVCAVVGGAKVSSKIGVLKNLLPKVDDLIIGGGMAFTFLKAQGASVGDSLVEEDYLETARQLQEEAKQAGVRLHLPEDVVAADRFANDAQTKIVAAHEVPAGWMGLDAGPEARKAAAAVIRASKAVLWNGPLGVFEMPSFAKGTEVLATEIAKATREGTFSLVGGGDSVAAVKSLGKASEMSYVSTGGGAMLEFLEGKSLPGIIAIEGKI